MTAVFVSYSHRDEAWKNKVIKHLRVLETAGIAIEVWDDRRIQVGDDWRSEISQALERCDVALMLVSADFLTSRFILGEEVPTLLRRRKDHGIRLIPLILSGCAWDAHAWLVNIQARPRDGKPLSTLRRDKQDSTLAELAREILGLKNRVTAKALNSHNAISFQSPAPAPAPSTNDQTGSVLEPALLRSRRLFGREALLKKMQLALTAHEVLAVYGFRGNGKSSLIESLQKTSLVAATWVRVNAASDHSAETLYARLAEVLGDRSEEPQVPSGTVEVLVQQLQKRCPLPQPVVVWVDRGHAWFAHGRQWADENLGRLFRALRRAYGSQLRWILELREQPTAALGGAGTIALEVPGIDRTGLADWLQAEAPSGHSGQWHYRGDDLKRLYQWLGNRRDDDRSQAANPMATRLLIEVARGRDQTPLQVLQHLLPEVEDRVDQALLADLYRNVLAPPERTLLDALALYRVAIPLDHVDLLEEALHTPGAWNGLERRCMLAADLLHERYHLHGFVAGWVRHRLGYPLDDELWTDSDLPESLEIEQQRLLHRLHSAVADAWLHQLGGTRRIARPNLERAVQALHHALSGGQTERLSQIAVELLGGMNRDEVLRRLWVHDTGLYRRKAPAADRIAVLDIITKLDSLDHKAWRFLGESLRRNHAPAAQVQHCFEQALGADPGFPPYLANLGHVLLRKGPTGAEQFLALLAHHRQDYPESVNAQVQFIEAASLSAVGRLDEASALRRACIAAGSRDSIFFNAEAEYQMRSGNFDEAFRVLDLADQCGATSDFTVATRARALQAIGREEEASKLRRTRIDEGTRDPVLYTSEAEHQLRIGNLAEAIRILDLAERAGAADAHTLSIRADALEADGRAAEASELRRAEINGGSRSARFYNNEAKYQIRIGNAGEALHILGLAETRGATDEYSKSIRVSALQATGQTAAASELCRAEIYAGSRDPVFYSMEAKHQLQSNNADECLRILDMAELRGASDNYTRSIRATALQATGRISAASTERRNHIEAGSRDSAFYAAEAMHLMHSGNTDDALKLLDLADRNGAGNDYILAIRANVLQTAGNAHAATALRMSRIEAGSRNATFYNDEARSQMRNGNSAEASRILELARQLGIEDDRSKAIRRKLRLGG